MIRQLPKITRIHDKNNMWNPILTRVPGNIPQKIIKVEIKVLQKLIGMGILQGIRKRTKKKVLPYSG